MPIIHILAFFLLLPTLHTYLSLSMTVVHYLFEVIKFLIYLMTECSSLNFLMCMIMRFCSLCFFFAMADAIVSLSSIFPNPRIDYS